MDQNMDGSRPPYKKAELNPHAVGFCPPSRRTDTNSISRHSYDLYTRPSSTTSNFSFASQISQARSDEGHDFSQSLAKFRLGDPFRENRNTAQHNDTFIDGGHRFHQIPGHNPNFSLFNQSTRDGRHYLSHHVTPPHSSPRRTSNSTTQSGSGCANSTPISDSSLYQSSSTNWKGRLGSSTRERHDSTQEQWVKNDEHSRAIARHIMAGHTAPPDDRGLCGGFVEGAQESSSAASTLAVHIKGSKMFGESSVDKSLIKAARSLGSRPQRPQPETRAAPIWFNKVMQHNYVPNLSEALASIPFLEPCHADSNSNTSVLRITNIPYAITRQEVIAFVGQQAQINRMPVGSPYFAVHIIMERESGKTMDCFIELSTLKEATWIANTMRTRAKSGRPPKIDNRTVDPKVSSQEELMHALFPRARHVAWNSNNPIIDFTPRQYYPSIPAAGFQGFLHSEEIVGMIKVAEQDNGRSFAGKAPCRVYETMISTIHKYPFHAVEYVTIGERRALFDLAQQMLQQLIDAVQNITRSTQNSRSKHQVTGPPPTEGLLEELIVAVLSCPGFSEKQKAAVAQKISAAGYERMTKGGPGLHLGGTHPLSSSWPFLVLIPAPEVDYNLIKYYASLLRDATLTREDLAYVQRLPPALAFQYKPFGNFCVDYGPRAESMSLAEAGCQELAQVQHVLQTILYTN